METMKEILWIILICTWTTTALNEQTKSHLFKKTEQRFESATLCNATFVSLLNTVRLLNDQCAFTPKELSYTNIKEREILLDIELRCNGKSRCEMDGFKLPNIYMPCGSGMEHAKNIDIYYWCLPSGGDSVHDISSSFNKSTIDVSNKPQYFIYNKTSSELNQIVCNIKGVLALTTITTQLLYVEWASECESLKENISIADVTYGCKTYRDEYKEKELNKKGGVRIVIFKQSGLVLLQIKAQTAINFDCKVLTPDTNTHTNISISGPTLKPSTNEAMSGFNLLFIVIPVSTLALIFLVTILILYRLGFICKNQPFKRIDTETDVPITSCKDGEYSTINDAASSAPRSSYDKVAYYAVDAQSLLLKQKQQQDEPDIDHHTTPTTPPRPRDNNYDEAEIEITYATVNKKPSSTALQVNREQPRSADDIDIQQNDNVYARLQHLQGSSKQTENVYSG